MQFIYSYPELRGLDGDLLDAGPVGEVARSAEAAGWEGLAFTEHPAPGARWLASGGHQTLDPFVALASAASVTTRLRLLTYLAVGPYRNPSLLAKTAASVDKVSNGRLILGMGTGYQKSEFFALGVDFEERNVLLDEVLDVLPMHWSGEPFSYRGAHFEARDVVARPRPVQDPIPIWLGGNARRTLRRIAGRCQGWMPLVGPAQVSATARTPHLETAADIAAKVAELRDLAGERGEVLQVAPSYADGTIADPTKDVERHRDAFGVLEAAGATWIIVPGASPSAAETRDFLQAFGSTYVGAKSR
ncbi:MAG TPA: LLM class F420-dependent oxidoreductase [Acidimicrobiales bacterium]|jgi:probable F420-dependent oxidoreductase|nr:LLM class F420-dependent oxidoreductase [Acidimicrobiales bacterium]